MYTKYFSDDGREFDDRQECEQYEYNLKMKDRFPTARFFNHDGRIVPFMASDDFCENLYYFEVNNIEEASALNNWFRDCGFDSPWKSARWGDNTIITTGRFFYDTDEDRWRNIEELYKAYQSLLSIFESAGE